MPQDDLTPRAIAQVIPLRTATQPAPVASPVWRAIEATDPDLAELVLDLARHLPPARWRGLAAMQLEATARLVVREGVRALLAELAPASATGGRAR